MRVDPEARCGPPAKGGTGLLADELALGLDAPICLTWELTYGCNLACVHCLSSSGRRDPAELSTSEALGFVDELAAMQVFYVNIGGGEPTLRSDFLEIVAHAVGSGVGVKFSTNGTTMTRARAKRYAAMSYLDIQVSLDGASPASNDPVRGGGSFAAALRAMERLCDASFGRFKVSVVVTRHNADELGELLALVGRYGAELRLTRLRPSGRGARSWYELRPSPAQLRGVHAFLVDHPEVLTGDSFFHLGPLGNEPLSGLNLCGAGRVVCLVDPIGDVYACPFVMHPEFRAGSIRRPGGFAEVWRHSELFAELRSPTSGGACSTCGAYSSCHGGCMAAKFFTGLPLDGPDPECVFGHGEAALASIANSGAAGVLAAARTDELVGHDAPGRPVPVAFRNASKQM
ncbi:MAG: mycofactocin radical SAM maturase [Acidimicrobiales bacterium]